MSHPIEDEDSWLLENGIPSGVYCSKGALLASTLGNDLRGQTGQTGPFLPL